MQHQHRDMSQLGGRAIHGPDSASARGGIGQRLSHACAAIATAPGTGWGAWAAIESVYEDIGVRQSFQSSIDGARRQFGAQ